MHIITAQFLTLAGIFLSMIGTFLLPFWWVGRRPQLFGGSSYQLAISLANCLSGGVFVATFFVGLMPEVRVMFEEVLRAYHVKSTFPVTELVIFMGFLVSLAVEQSVLEYQERNSSDYTLVASTTDDNSARDDAADDKTKSESNSGASSNVEREDSERNTSDYDSDTNSQPSQLIKKKDEKANNRKFGVGNNRQETGHSHGVGHRQGTGHSHGVGHRQGTGHSHGVGHRQGTGHSHGVGHRQGTGHSHGVGHSHGGAGHSHADISHLLQGEAGIRVGLLMVSLGVHSVFEGLALGLQSNVPTLVNLFIGVAIHELLVAFAMGVNVSRLVIPFPTALKLGVIFSSSIPVGQVLGLLIGRYQSTSGQAVSAVLQGLAAGTFIHVTFLEVIPAEFQEKGPRLIKVFFLCLGFLLLLGCTLTIQGVSHHRH